MNKTPNRQKRYCSVINLDSSETISYNNPLFLVYIGYGYLSHYPNYSGVSRWHNDLEFISVKKGTFCVHWTDDVKENLLYFELLEGFCSMIKLLYQNLSGSLGVIEHESLEIVSLKNMITFIEEHFMEHIALSSARRIFDGVAVATAGKSNTADRQIDK